ncbi:MAG: PP2C family protein-serine/threonine phosphatase, partial [Dehalococcoidia bacterium]|nr:PP2C family protein-serine/threonine phosphatase [Dehalococcoidia bacterium]
LLRRRDGRVERLETGGIALGMFEGSTYSAAETGLAAGDVLTLYSDGVTEAEDQEGTPFDEAGLERAVETRAGQRAADIGAGIVSAVAAHARATKLADDLTVLVVRHAGR